MNKLDFFRKQKEEHAKFRETPQWLMFRKFMLSSHNMTCDFCKTPYKQAARLDVHHMYDTNYQRLEADRFMVLCKQCHTFIHSKDRSPAFKSLVHRVDYVTLPQEAHEHDHDYDCCNKTAHG